MTWGVTQSDGTIEKPFIDLVWEQGLVTAYTDIGVHAGSETKIEEFLEIQAKKRQSKSHNHLIINLLKRTLAV